MQSQIYRSINYWRIELEIKTNTKIPMHTPCLYHVVNIDKELNAIVPPSFIKNRQEVTSFKMTSCFISLNMVLEEWV